MKRRTAIIGLGSLAVGSSAAIGTSAFTQVEADRELAVDVRNDDEAYLALRPVDIDGDPVDDLTEGDTGRIPETDEQNRSFALIDDESGRINIAVTALNADATTEIRSVFQIENQGRNEIDAHVEISFEADTGDGHPEAIKVSTADDTSLDDEDNPVRIGSGKNIVVDLTFETDGIGPEDEIADMITVHGTDPERGESQ